MSGQGRIRERSRSGEVTLLLLIIIIIEAFLLLLLPRLLLLLTMVVTQVGARNSHLVKLYAVSFIQLIMVLGVVVIFTEIKEVFIMSLLF